MTEVITRVGIDHPITLADLPLKSHARVFYERVPLAMLREAGMIGRHTETEAYLRIAAERYRLLRTHSWGGDVLRALLEGRRRR